MKLDFFIAILGMESNGDIPSICYVPRLKKTDLKLAIKLGLDAFQEEAFASTNNQRRNGASGRYIQLNANETYSMEEYNGPPLPQDWKNQLETLWNLNDCETHVTKGPCNEVNLMQSRMEPCFNGQNISLNMELSCCQTK
jgi:hypothetical protein